MIVIEELSVLERILTPLLTLVALTFSSNLKHPRIWFCALSFKETLSRHRSVLLFGSKHGAFFR